MENPLPGSTSMISCKMKSIRLGYALIRSSSSTLHHCRVRRARGCHDFLMSSLSIAILALRKLKPAHFLRLRRAVYSISMLTMPYLMRARTSQERICSMSTLVVSMNTVHDRTSRDVAKLLLKSSEPNSCLYIRRPPESACERGMLGIGLDTSI